MSQNGEIPLAPIDGARAEGDVAGRVAWDEPERVSSAAPTRSLIEDFEALIDDGRTYFEAEVSYQKTRASFVVDRIKKAVVFVVCAGFLAILAAIGLTVGLIIALTPLLTGWGATAVVVLALLLGTHLLVRRAGNYWAGAAGAMRPEAGEDEA